jgi:hypothetical protein
MSLKGRATELLGGHARGVLPVLLGGIDVGTLVNMQLTDEPISFDARDGQESEKEQDQVHRAAGKYSLADCTTYGHVGYGYVSVFCIGPCPTVCAERLTQSTRSEC